MAGYAADVSGAQCHDFLGGASAGFGYARGYLRYVNRRVIRFYEEAFFRNHRGGERVKTKAE